MDKPMTAEKEAAAQPALASIEPAYRVQHRHEFYIVNEENESIATATIFFKADGLYVTNVWTQAKHRRKGLAKKVLAALIEQFGQHDLYLSVSPYYDQPLDDEALTRFYASFGFEVIAPMGLMLRKAQP